jgi:hypothetical protein
LRRCEIQIILNKISEFDSNYGELGLKVFIERGLFWYDDYRILIRLDSIDVSGFNAFETWIISNGLKWSCVSRGEESFLVIHSRPL